MLLKLRVAALILLAAAVLCAIFPPTYATVLRFEETEDLPVVINTGAVSVSARAAVLIDAADGNVLYAKNAGERLPMASTTKIMTAIVAIESADIDMIVEIPPAAVGVEGSSVYLYKGERLTLSDLLYALMLGSANDAATAIAIAVGGDIEGFAALMNDKAAELGLSDTHFKNPHGLDATDHYTTALDLALLSAYALKNETFAKIVSTKKTTIPLNGSEGVRLLINHNRMLRSYEGAVGVKTGFTRRSGRCLVSAAVREGLGLVAVTLRASDDWNDHRKMLDYGFSSYVSLNLAEEGGYDLTMPVVGGSCEWVKCTNSEAIRVTLPSGHGSITSRIECSRFLYSPVEAGEVIGELIFYCDGKIIGTSPIITLSSSEYVGKPRGLIGWIKALFGF